MEDNLRLKTTFGERRSLMEHNHWMKTTFYGRWLMLHQKAPISSLAGRCFVSLSQPVRQLYFQFSDLNCFPDLVLETLGSHFGSLIFRKITVKVSFAHSKLFFFVKLSPATTHVSTQTQTETEWSIISILKGHFQLDGYFGHISAIKPDFDVGKRKIDLLS